MGANETRAAVAQIENQAGISNGVLQGLFEHTTGWRAGQSALPSWRREGVGSKADEIAESALRLQQKAAEFNGITPLAIDAYLRGDKATKESLATGQFPEKAVDDMYGVLKRSEKYGGEPLTPEAVQEMQSIFGQAPKDLEKYARAKPPRIEGEDRTLPAQNEQTAGAMFNPNAQLIKQANGRYATDDPLLNLIMQIESNGNPSAVSSTGAKGLFQFTKGTGGGYGLVNDDKGIDRRADPNANFEAMKRLTADNIAGLQRNGIPVTPSTVYMAHQQGLSGTLALYEAARTGKPVSKKLRHAMDVNGGKGLTPQEFIAKWENNVNKKASEVGLPLDNTASYVQSDQSAAPPMPGLPEDTSADTSTPIAPPTAETTAPSFSAEQYMAKEIQPQVDWKALAKQIFNDTPDSHRPPQNVSKAIKGVLGSVMV